MEFTFFDVLFLNITGLWLFTVNASERQIIYLNYSFLNFKDNGQAVFYDDVSLKQAFSTPYAISDKDIVLSNFPEASEPVLMRNFRIEEPYFYASNPTLASKTSIDAEVRFLRITPTQKPEGVDGEALMAKRTVWSISGDSTFRFTWLGHKLEFTPCKDLSKMLAENQENHLVKIFDTYFVSIRGNLVSQIYPVLALSDTHIIFFDSVLGREYVMHRIE
jgi:hypothetical protein